MNKSLTFVRGQALRLRHEENLNDEMSQFHLTHLTIEVASKQTQKHQNYPYKSFQHFVGFEQYNKK